MSGTIFPVLELTLLSACMPLKMGQIIILINNKKQEKNLLEKSFVISSSLSMTLLSHMEQSRGEAPISSDSLLIGTCGLTCCSEEPVLFELG